jgi:hypothetical protein
MGYVEKILGDNEYVVYRTHQHIVALLQRILGSLFAFVVFFGSGLVVLLAGPGDEGTKLRFAVGLIALGSLAMPIYLVVVPWIRGQRGRGYLERIWRWALAGLLILVVALVMMIRPDLKYIGWIAVAISLIPLAELVRCFLDWLNERYIITNRRVMEVKGIINKHVRDSALEKVNDVDLKQSVIGRMLSYGTVQIITGSDIGMNMFRRISNPVRFKRAMLNSKENLHGTGLLAQEQAPATARPPTPAVKMPMARLEPSTPSNIPDLIVELDELRQKGIITEEEFQTKKTELLARL